MFDTFLINGKFSDGLNPFDRGLAFGDGVFRTFKVFNKLPTHWKYHYEKLVHDAKILKIQAPNEKVFIDDINVLFAKNNRTFVAKFIITRGFSDRGYSIPANISPNRILIKSDYKPLKSECYEKGVELEFSNIRLAINNSLGSIKHLNRLENVLAKQELSAHSFDAIMLDDKGYINECASHNIVMRSGDILYFPKQNDIGVSGVSIMIVMTYAEQLALKVVECQFTEEQLLHADEIVIINSVNGAVPVNKIKNKKWNSTKLAYEINKLFKRIS